jgi:cell division protein FtsL
MIQTRTTTFTPRRTQVQSMRRNQNATRYKTETKLGPVAHTVLIALMITVLGLIYLTQATKTTAYSYEAQGLDTEISELTAKKSELEVQNARLTALERVKGSAVASAMTTPQTTDYAQ